MKAVGVLFDKDGTLLDFEATYGPACLRMIDELSQGDETLASRLAEAVGFDLASSAILEHSVLIAGTAADQAVAWGPLLGRIPDAGFASFLDVMWARHSASTAMEIEGTTRVLENLAALGLTLGIATNDAEANARVHADTADLSRLMAFFAGYDSGHGAKPGPGMVLAFAEHCASPPQGIVMVGDSLHDMHAARAAGAVAVAVTTGPATREQLVPHADYVIDSLDELASLPPLMRV